MRRRISRERVDAGRWAPHLFGGSLPRTCLETIGPVPTARFLNSTRRRRGFTLVEMFIVGALIALFSSLAIFGVQQQFNSNIRKAAIGESRNIAVALDFANLDTSVFPKLCWLTESQTGLDFIVNQTSLNVYLGADIYGRPVFQDGALRNQWEGPYFSLSSSRRGVSQGRTGIVDMAFADFPSSAGTFRWPSDPYGTPYTVYMLDIDTQAATLSFVTERAPDNPTIKGNFVNAVVSYGLNLAPGGDEDTQRAGFENLQLFRGIPGKGSYEWRPRSEFVGTGAFDRANIWSRDFIGNSGAGLPSTRAGLVVGISDPESDDIVFEF